MATHSNVLAWRIPGTGEPGGLPAMVSHRIRHDWSDLADLAVSLFGYKWKSHLYPKTYDPASTGLQVRHDWSNLADLAVSLFGYKWKSHLYPKTYDPASTGLQDPSVLHGEKGNSVSSEKCFSDTACRKSVDSNSGAFHLDLVAAYVWTSVHKRWAYSHISGHMNWRHGFQTMPKTKKGIWATESDFSFGSQLVAEGEMF